MRKFVKIFTSLMLCLSLIVGLSMTFTTTVYAIGVGHEDVDPTNPNPGDGGDDDVGGTNWWFFVPSNSDNLTLEVWVHNTGAPVTRDMKYGNYWAFPTAKSLKIKSSIPSGISVTDDGSAYALLCHVSGHESNSWSTYADRLNAEYGTTYTSADVIAAVDEFLAPRVVNDTWSNSCVWGEVGVSKLVRLNLNDLLEPQEKTEDEPGSTDEVENEYKWVLYSLRGTTSGDSFDRDTNGLDEYNARFNFSNTDAKYNNLNPLSNAWNGVPNLSYERANDYSVNTTNNTNATYYQIKRTRTRIKYWTEHKHYTYNQETRSWDYTGSTYDGPYYTPWSPWSYSVNQVSTVSNSSSLTHTVYEPHFNTYNWLDLTSEQFTHDTALQTGSGVKPNDYKDADGFSNTNLNVTLISGKTAGDMFEILSDNNPKEVGLNFTDIFGVPGLTTTRSATVNTTYVVSDTFHYGPQMNPASSTPLISIQRTGPTNGQETFNHEYISYNGSPVNFAAKIRSIKYGTYILGDAKHSNYWYTTLRLATVNNFGSRYNVSAPGVVGSPSGSVISITPTDLRNDIALSASYIQPVLVGDIDVKDAAGN